MPTTRVPRLLIVGSLALALTVATACGSDDDTAATTTASAKSETSAVPGAADPSSNPDDPYCDVEREIDAIFGDAVGQLGAAPTEEQMQTAIQQASQRVVDEGLLDTADQLAPDAIRTDVDALFAAVRAATGGNVDAFANGDVDAADAKVNAYCGLTDS